jgi:hypothetical protein
VTELDQRVDATARLLLGNARDANMVISGDMRVSAADAERLLGVSSLKSLREDGDGPPGYRIPINGSRWSYRIDDLARWLEARRS